MFLFKLEHVEPILKGTKIETRRISEHWRANVRSTHLAKTQMLSREYFARLYVYDRWEELLGEISEESARNEGYGSKEEYLRKFAEINRKKLKTLPYPLEEIRVRVYKFRVIR